MSPNTRKVLTAVIACRNNGSRLYGKPLQHLCIKSRYSILDQVITNIKSINWIEKIVLAISEGVSNEIFKIYAKDNGLDFIVGSETDVLSRLISGLKHVDGTDLFRITSESPYLYWQLVNQAWEIHKNNDFDATFLDDIIDGCGFEIIKSDSLNKSWRKGNNNHRSEFCTLYIRENKNDFDIHKLQCPSKLIRKDLRLTVDYPEDLVICRELFSSFENQIRNVSYDLNDMVDFLII